MPPADNVDFSDALRCAKLWVNAYRDYDRHWKHREFTPALHGAPADEILDAQRPEEAAPDVKLALSDAELGDLDGGAAMSGAEHAAESDVASAHSPDVASTLPPHASPCPSSSKGKSKSSSDSSSSSSSSDSSSS